MVVRGVFMELKKAIELFLGGYKPGTQQAYRYPLQSMRDFLGPARPMESVTPAMLVEYFQTVVDQRGYSPHTKQKHIKAAKVFFNRSVRLELIEKSPAKAVKGKRLAGAVDRAKAMTDEELALLLEAVRFKPQALAVLLFLADTGCRRGGAAGLRIQDVNWEKLVAIVTEKGDKSRNVAFGEKCARAMLQWLAYRDQHFRIEGVYLFSRNGLPIQPNAIGQIIRRACKTAKVRSLGSHSLRHRKGCQMADHHVAPGVAATALGHTDPMITLTYYYPADWESAEKALRALATDPDAERPTSPKVVNFPD
jgi:integrase/recombinase XerD